MHRCIVIALPTSQNSRRGSAVICHIFNMKRGKNVFFPVKRNLLSSRGEEARIDFLICREM